MDLVRLVAVIILGVVAIEYVKAQIDSSFQLLEEPDSQNITIYPDTCISAPESGIQTIHPQPGFGEPFPVFCDQEYDADGGWIVIQNRFDGSVFFYRSWKEYENGFGSLNGEFWLGLAKIHELTSSKRYQLSILLEDQEGSQAMANYTHLLVAGPEARYKLVRLGEYSGTAGDSLQHHLNMTFSTFDADHDLAQGNCADFYMSGWWYYDCFHSDLNGLYWDSGTGGGMSWHKFREYNILKRSRMMIRAVGG